MFKEKVKIGDFINLMVEYNTMKNKGIKIKICEIKLKL